MAQRSQALRGEAGPLLAEMRQLIATLLSSAVSGQQHVAVQLSTLLDQLGRVIGAETPIASAGRDLRALTNRPLLRLAADPKAQRGALLGVSLHVITQAIVQLARAERASVFVWDRNTGDMVAIVTASHDSQPAMPLRLPAQTGIVGHVYQTGVAVNLLQTETVVDPVYRFIDKQMGFHIRNLLCFPVTRVRGTFPIGSGDTPLGVLQVVNKREENEFSPQDELLVAEYSQVLGYALGLLEPGDLTSRDFHDVQTLANLYESRSGGLYATETVSAPLDSLAPAVAIPGETFAPNQAAPRLQKLIYRLGNEVVRPNETKDGTGGRAPHEIPDKLETSGTLKEVALYVAKIEACWMESRKQCIELQQNIARVTQQFKKASAALADVMAWCNVRGLRPLIILNEGRGTDTRIAAPTTVTEILDNDPSSASGELAPPAQDVSLAVHRMVRMLDPSGNVFPSSVLDRFWPSPPSAAREALSPAPPVPPVKQHIYRKPQEYFHLNGKAQKERTPYKGDSTDHSSRQNRTNSRKKIDRLELALALPSLAREPGLDAEELLPPREFVSLR
eukprot:TRINITY_DN26305_c0_g1_i1.p1 TRINITY_DN26305_c0_g1~~TRINITY_DN26305_c0_g1_i1.p1  ORF type:complete len:570 (+),score=79.53 TRINITY_DN26305_c0_g1_i1:26-1711(+)